MSKGYVAAYEALGDPDYLEAAKRNLAFLIEAGRRPDGGLHRTYKAGAAGGKGRFAINGFLEDYAFTAEALIALYQATFEEKWLNAAKELATYAIKHFRDPASGLFFFTSDLDAPLVARKMELMDNVTPGSNSAMAKVLFALGSHFGDSAMADMAASMLAQVKEAMPSYGSGYSNWAMLALNLAAPFHEVVIAGPDAEARRKEFSAGFHPNALLAGASGSSALPLLEGRLAGDSTRIYVCRDRVCKLPVATVAEASAQLESA
jgi:uncharacterized protein YyaL (SSP411 family)